LKLGGTNARPGHAVEVIDERLRSARRRCLSLGFSMVATVFIFKMARLIGKFAWSLVF
jgi:hypothetical protein